MKGQDRPQSKVFLVSYPKIIFMYPTFVASLAGATYLSVFQPSLNPPGTATIVLSVIFLGVWATNLVVMAFIFPRASSLAPLFFMVAVAVGCVLLAVMKPQFLPYVAATLRKFHPSANASFYWVFSLSLGLATMGAIIAARFDFWEARPNELLHHPGLWGDVDRFPAPGVRIDKEISDVFEYLLLRPGRLTLHMSGEQRPVVLDNDPFISSKEKALIRLLGSLQVAFRANDKDVAQDTTHE
jgi:hypothetical protein